MKIIIFVTIFLISLSAILILTHFIMTPLKISEVLINIEAGESAGSIAHKLSSAKIILSPLAFRTLVKVRKEDKHLSKGQYLFKGKLNLLDVIDILKKAKVVLQKITIPEGLTIDDTALLFQQKSMADYQKFKALCHDRDFICQILGFDIPSLEGFLYPETYYFHQDASESYIISTLVNTFKKKIKPPDVLPFGLNFYEVLILASIVEKEAFLNREKPAIAGVYLNRLAKKMKLQADPTVMYLLRDKKRKTRKVYYKDLEIDSGYNTYMYAGLPPTPICSPPFDSFQAVLMPLKTAYLYFFADKTGTHIFSETYRQHLLRQSLLKVNNGNI